MPEPSTAEQRPVLSIQGLTIRFPRASGAPRVVDGADLSIDAGEIHGLVGESGSGKTLLARAILGLLPPGAQVTGGAIRFRGRELTQLPAPAIRSLRGSGIGMVFQEPMMSLNPALRIGTQMGEALRLHERLADDEIRRRSIEMLTRVRMPDPAGCLRRYPHEFSGGMRQRIMLASVLLMRPALLLADEPTTALDVLIQQEVLEIMLQVVRELGTAVLLITHDLGLVARYAQRLSVMERGRIVEDGTVERILAGPARSYARRLLDALPRRASGESDTGESGRPLVIVRNLSVSFRKASALPWRRAAVVRALRGVSFDIRRHETLAVVGESGSGKTTLGRAILKLVAPAGGQVLFDGTDIAGVKGEAGRTLRRRMQIIFQDPYSSLDPRKRIGQIVGEGLRLIPQLARADRKKKVADTLKAVEIDPGWIDRYPHELSGGQRQRIGIARAIITNPRLVVADEAVSALDLTVQAQVLALLKRLQRDIGFSYLFITHDLGVVEQIADRVMVLLRGRVVELGPRDDILDRPRHPYTCALLNAVPVLTGDAGAGYRLSERRYARAPDMPEHEREDLWSPDEQLVQVGAGHFVAARPAG